MENINDEVFHGLLLALAGFLFSMFFDWRNTFIVSGIIALFMGFLAYFIFPPQINTRNTGNQF